MCEAGGNGHEPGLAGRHSVAGILLTGLATGDPAEVSQALDAIRSANDALSDQALGAMVAAADEILARWREESERLHMTWAEYQRMARDEGETRRSLMAVIALMVQVAGSPRADRSGSHKADTIRDMAKAPGIDISRNSIIPGSAFLSPSASGGSELAACLLGPFRLFRAGRPLESWAGGAKASRVLCYLLSQRGRSVHREALIDIFWQDADPQQARRNLNQTIYVIRKATRTHRDSSEYVLYQNDCYAINAHLGLWCDVDQFESRIGSGRSAERQNETTHAIAAYEQATALYSGDYLEDQPYADWAAAERDRLRLLYLDGLNHLADLRLAHHEVEAALELTESVLRREPCDEVALRRALRCHALAGNRALVAQRYHRYIQDVQHELGLPPSPETDDLYNSLVR